MHRRAQIGKAREQSQLLFLAVASALLNMRLEFSKNTPFATCCESDCTGSIHAGLFRRPARLGQSSDYTPAWAPLVRAPDAAGRRCRSARTGPARRSGRACGKASRPGARPRTPWPRGRGRWRRPRGRSAPGHREWRNDAARHHLQPMPAGGTAMLESMGRIGAACFLATETE